MECFVCFLYRLHCGADIVHISYIDSWLYYWVDVSYLHSNLSIVRMARVPLRRLPIASPRICLKGVFAYSKILLSRIRWRSSKSSSVLKPYKFNLCFRAYSKLVSMASST